MNYLIRPPNGDLVAMTPAEATKADAYLFTKMESATDPDRVAIQRLRDGLRHVMHPETHYVEQYAPEGYVPGWVP